MMERDGQRRPVFDSMAVTGTDLRRPTIKTALIFFYNLVDLASPATSVMAMLPLIHTFSGILHLDRQRQSGQIRRDQTLYFCFLQ